MVTADPSQKYHHPVIMRCLSENNFIAHSTTLLHSIYYIFSSNEMFLDCDCLLPLTEWAYSEMHFESKLLFTLNLLVTRFGKRGINSNTHTRASKKKRKIEMK